MWIKWLSEFRIWYSRNLLTLLVRHTLHIMRHMESYASKKLRKVALLVYLSFIVFALQWEARTNSEHTCPARLTSRPGKTADKLIVKAALCLPTDANLHFWFSQPAWTFPSLTHEIVCVFCRLFTGRSAEASIDLTLWLSQWPKPKWAVCLLSADCLLGQILFRAAGHLENFPSCLSPSTSIKYESDIIVSSVTLTDCYNWEFQKRW